MTAHAMMRLTSNQASPCAFSAFPSPCRSCAPSSPRWSTAGWSRDSRRARDPLKLAQATLYLPTRRAGRLAREIFLDELKTDAAILPRIVALGDIDEDELAFAEGAEQFGGVGAARHSAEARRTGAPADAGASGRGMGEESRCSAPLVVGGPASTLALAGDLARLMDDMVTRGVAWERARRTGARTSSTNTGSTRSNSCGSRARHGRRICRKSAGSSRPRGATS